MVRAAMVSAVHVAYQKFKGGISSARHARARNAHRALHMHVLKGSPLIYMHPAPYQ